MSYLSHCYEQAPRVSDVTMDSADSHIKSTHFFPQASVYKESELQANARTPLSVVTGSVAKGPSCTNTPTHKKNKSFLGNIIRLGQPTEPLPPMPPAPDKLSTRPAPTQSNHGRTKSLANLLTRAPSRRKQKNKPTHNHSTTELPDFKSCTMESKGKPSAKTSIDLTGGRSLPDLMTLSTQRSASIETSRPTAHPLYGSSSSLASSSHLSFSTLNNPSYSGSTLAELESTPSPQPSPSPSFKMSRKGSMNQMKLLFQRKKKPSIGSITDDELRSWKRKPEAEMEILGNEREAFTSRIHMNSSFGSKSSFDNLRSVVDSEVLFIEPRVPPPGVAKQSTSSTLKETKELILEQPSVSRPIRPPLRLQSREPARRNSFYSIGDDPAILLAAQTADKYLSSTDYILSEGGYYTEEILPSQPEPVLESRWELESKSVPEPSAQPLLITPSELVSLKRTPTLSPVPRKSSMLIPPTNPMTCRTPSPVASHRLKRKPVPSLLHTTFDLDKESEIRWKKHDAGLFSPRDSVLIMSNKENVVRGIAGSDMVSRFI